MRDCDSQMAQDVLHIGAAKIVLQVESPKRSNAPVACRLPYRLVLLAAGVESLNLFGSSLLPSHSGNMMPSSSSTNVSSDFTLLPR
jgi:hypothetical protein